MKNDYQGVQADAGNIHSKDDLNEQEKVPRMENAGPVLPEEEEEEGEGRGSRERRKIEIKFIQDKGRRHITFSKRKHGIMKKAWELSILTGTQVLLLVVSETGLVYTYSTPKLQPLVTQAEGKKLIQDCLNAPDIPREEEKPADQGVAAPPQTAGQGQPLGQAGAAMGQAAGQMMHQQAQANQVPGQVPVQVPGQVPGQVPTSPQRMPMQPGMIPHDQIGMRQPYMQGLEPGTMMIPNESMAQMPEGYIPPEYGYLQGQQQPPQRYSL